MGLGEKSQLALGRTQEATGQVTSDWEGKARGLQYQVCTNLLCDLR
jgi:hypothetical protein